MLTKGRVVQLIFMFVVLLGMFFWRTFDENYNQVVIEKHQLAIRTDVGEPVVQQSDLLLCDYTEPCQFASDKGVFLLKVTDLPIKAEQWIDFELTLPFENGSINKAQIVGKSMFMGKIPLSFNKISAKTFTTKAMVGACSDAQMIWSLQITIVKNDLPQMVSFDFIVQR